MRLKGLHSAAAGAREGDLSRLGMNDNVVLFSIWRNFIFVNHTSCGWRIYAVKQHFPVVIPPGLLYTSHQGVEGKWEML